jgi:hypothetical protein
VASRASSDRVEAEITVPASLLCEVCDSPIEPRDIECLAMDGPCLVGHHHCVVPVLSRITEVLTEVRASR